MNSHCQPESPARRLRKDIAVVSRPPNAPATATEEAEIAILVALSSGLYQKKRCIMIPGKKPASARPRKMRHARSPPDVLTATVQTVTMPQETLIREIHWLEEKYYRRTLEQNSLRTYGTKKRATATL
jgi:hypothetical protein